MFLKILQNSQGNTCVRTPLLIKLQAEKFLKINEKTPAKNSQNFHKKYQSLSLVFNKVAGWMHNINIKFLIHLHFFIEPL